MRAPTLIAGLLLLACGGPAATPSCPGGDCLPPAVEISSPGRMALLAGTVSVGGTVSDLPGIAVFTELLVDGEVVAATMAAGSFQLSFDTATRSEGTHQLQVRATDAAGNQGAAEVMVQILPPGAACMRESWQLRYWRGRDTTAAPQLERCEAVPIDYWWGEGGPEGPQPADNFSATWNGRWTFAAGTYRFDARVDDGIRLTIDGEVLIDEWRTQAPTDFAATRVMTAGVHTVLVEYFENTGFAELRLRWTPAP